jgi:rubrerythrin
LLKESGGKMLIEYECEECEYKEIVVGIEPKKHCPHCNILMTAHELEE